VKEKNSITISDNFLYRRPLYSLESKDEEYKFIDPIFFTS